MHLVYGANQNQNVTTETSVTVQWRLTEVNAVSTYSRYVDMGVLSPELHRLQLNVSATPEQVFPTTQLFSCIYFSTKEILRSHNPRYTSAPV